MGVVEKECLAWVWDQSKPCTVEIFSKILGLISHNAVIQGWIQMTPFMGGVGARWGEIHWSLVLFLSTSFQTSSSHQQFYLDTKYGYVCKLTPNDLFRRWDLGCGGG